MIFIVSIIAILFVLGASISFILLLDYALDISGEYDDAKLSNSGKGN